MNVTQVFAAGAVRHLREEYIPRIETAVSVLPEEDLWWRPHQGSNSVGNLLLHLEGNVRQWILAGVGGRRDDRRRSEEFAAREGASADQLLGALRATVDEACEVILSISQDQFLRRLRVQTFEPTVLDAVLHVVEHFSWHTGQIAYVAKFRAGADHGLRYYDDDALEE